MISESKKPSQDYTRVGFIGVGPHAKNVLLPALKTVQGISLVAISSRSLERAEQYAEQYGVSYYTDSWQELIDPKLVSCVFVAGPPQLHVEVLRMCLEKSISVFVEKPPALNLDDLKTLVDLEKSSNAIAFVDYNFRFSETFLNTLELLGGKNTIRCLKVRCISSKPMQPLWSCATVIESYLYAVGIHAIEMTTTLFGEPKDILASICCLSEEKFTLNLVLDFNDDRKATLDLGNYSDRFDYSCEIINNTGLVATIIQHNRIQCTGLHTQIVAPEAFKKNTLLEYTWPSLHGGYACSGYSSAIESFVRSVRLRMPSESPLANSVPVFNVINRTILQILV